MVAAARLTDPITHTGSLTGMLLGIAAGVVVGAALVAAEVVTGGLATVAIVGLCAATGGGIGAFLGSLSWATSVVGSIVGPGSPNVLINFLPAARAHLDMVLCSQHCPPPVPIAQGSDSVFINGMPAARVHDMSACSGLIGQGSPNVFIGGGTKTTDAINPEIPTWLSYTVLAVGVVSAAVLFGPVTAVLGLVGGYVGGEIGGAIGGAIFGEGSDGQKWMAFGGSMVGGIMTGGLGAAGDEALGTEGLLLRGGEPVVPSEGTPKTAGVSDEAPLASSTGEPPASSGPEPNQGGSHSNTSKPANDGLDSHHMPSSDAIKQSNLTRNEGPAIKMDPEDHQQTASWGSSKDSQAYRAQQADLIKQGKFDEAQRMDIDDVQGKFGNKYDDHIQQMQDYTKSLDPQKLQPKKTD